MSNTFSVCRSIWTDPQFPNEPFTKREAWLWIVSEASWKERTVRIGSSVVELQRGQLAVAVRGLAQIWGWKKTKVERFLDALTQDKNIGTDTETGVTRITVCNYEKFQNAPNGKKTPIGTAPGQHRDSTGTILNKDEIPEGIPESPPKSPKGKYHQDFEKFWEAFPKRKGNNPKEPAFKKWQGRIKGGVPAEEMLQGAIGYARARAGQDAQYTQQVTTWLNQAGWEQYTQPSKPQLVHSSEQILISSHEEPELFDEAVHWAKKFLPYAVRSGQEHIKIPADVAINLRQSMKESA
jgi:hypothetical protein